jgi:acetyltransferase-like isoleucine patch superfamily enzyme
MLFMSYGRNVYFFPGVHIVRPRYIRVGDNVTIGRNADLYVHPEDPETREAIIEIGNNVYIGTNNILGARKKIVLEENVLLGPHVLIGDHSHQYEDVDLPIKFQAATEGGPVRIERDCWIGANVFIFPKVTIGRHTVIGANSIVNRDIPPYCVAVGTPARVIKRYDFELKQWVKVNG